MPEVKSEERGSDPSKHKHAKDEVSVDIKESGNADKDPALPLQQCPPKARTTDILCHRNVLSARSPYFEAALSGGWNEVQTKMAEVVLEKEQAVQDMKLLIMLCYSGSYTKDGETCSIYARA